MESLESLLGEANRRAASEVLLMAGDAPAMRAPGPWMRLTAARCTPAEVEAVVKDAFYTSAEEWAAARSSGGSLVERSWSRWGGCVAISIFSAEAWWW